MKNFYITTSIAYTNAPPHIGFALESIQADVLARYNKSLKKDVFFLTGTDEHGTKIAKAAKKSGKNPKDFVDDISNQFRNLAKILNLSNNDFIRTTDKERHWPSVKEVWLKLKKKGDIYKKEYKGLYCSGCEAFIKERELIDGKCPIHLENPEEIIEENYFFKLSRYLDKVKKAIEDNKLDIIPKTKKNEILSIINQEPEDVSFSRPKEKLGWGIPVPDDDTQIVYVWADALSNYISALDYPNGEKFKKYWPADIHCIGKDILKFHALIWPAMLISLGLALPKKIFVHGFITSGGKKMSKSLGNVVGPFALVEKYGTDALRYYLLAEIPPDEDGDFTFEKFETRYNSDLAGGIGNLLSRVRTMADNKISNGEFQTANKISNPELSKIIKTTKKDCKQLLESFKFNEALKSIWKLIGFCDKYINDEKPWGVGDKKLDIKNQKVINDLIFALSIVAELSAPFLPETSEKILKGIEIDKKTGKFRNVKGRPLFPRLLT
jgi:methionyl-tRNA synthetase